MNFFAFTYVLKQQGLFYGYEKNWLVQRWGTEMEILSDSVLHYW